MGMSGGDGFPAGMSTKTKVTILLAMGAIVALSYYKGYQTKNHPAQYKQPLTDNIAKIISTYPNDKENNFHLSNQAGFMQSEDSHAAELLEMLIVEDSLKARKSDYSTGIETMDLTPVLQDMPEDKYITYKGNTITLLSRDEIDGGKNAGTGYQLKFLIKSGQGAGHTKELKVFGTNEITINDILYR